MKKALLILLYLLVSLFVGCAAPMTYDELEEQARLTGDYTKLHKFEENADKANLHFQNRAACMASIDHLWCCVGSEVYNERRPPKTVERMVSVYRQDKHTCFCGTSENKCGFTRRW